ncbi:SWIM zinc finger family protein [Rhizohabitans arisaemae]|uniref:SWIM zinc finger family protein n=1 Tax=Rhizohabitans arisaemae TaxID=2720610 RepID=UPI0024B0A550|nr:SWIM zinc finger family protein [Rhizohabitans arisaemae]
MTETARGFPPFPPGRRPTRRAGSWWGTAWIKALEDTSLDQTLLHQGRRYATTGHVGSITVSPGRISAPVHDARADTPYHTIVRVEVLGEQGWRRFLDQVAMEAGHIAALLEGEMPHRLVTAAADAGVQLLPGIGDLEPECECPDWGHPCKHAAALCYQAAWLLDEDPFLLLLLRGRGERELLDALHRRDAPVTRGGTPARDAYALGTPPLPDPPEPVSAPPPEPPPTPGLDPGILRVLVADAALRARELLTGAAPSHDLALWPDTVRLAAVHDDPPLRARLRAAAGEKLDRAAQAWRFGGAAGLKTLEAAWNPTRADLTRAGAALAAAAEESGVAAPPVPDRNHWTFTVRGAQLRLGRDGLWHPYTRREDGEWWPAGPPSADPAVALTHLPDTSPG